MLPFAILGFVMKPLQMKGFSASGLSNAFGSIEREASEVEGIPNGSHSLSNDYKRTSSKDESPIMAQLSRFLKDMKVLLADKVYVVNVLGYIAYNFVIGAYSYWGPKAGYNIYHMNNADIVFGGVTIICGIVGTLAGGFVLDLMTATISNAFKLLSVATFFGAIFCFVAFCFKSLYGFLAFFAIGELLVFATQGPVNYVCLHTVKPSIRPLSMAMSTVSIHIFGDVPSSPLVGILQDYLNDWRKTALILTSIFFLASAIWFIGIFLHSVDRFNEESEHSVDRSGAPSTMPLLKEDTIETTESIAEL